MSKARKIIDDIRQNNGTEIDLVDKGIVNLMDAPGLCKYSKFWLVDRLPVNSSHSQHTTTPSAAREVVPRNSAQHGRCVDLSLIHI